MAHDPKLAAELVMRCFHIRTNAHVLHLSTRSYSQHKALDGFYNAIIEQADDFAECYQGEYDLLDLSGEYKQSAQPIAMLTELRDWIVANRAAITDESFLQNIIDELRVEIARTLYFLKKLA